MNKEFKVPIKNVFYMLCYAWDILDYSEKALIGSEDFDNIYDLLARVLIDEVKLLVKRGFYKEYINNEDRLVSLKGKININKSIKENTIVGKSLYCIFDEYSDNVLFNQIIKYCLETLIKNPDLNKQLVKDIKSLLVYFNNIKSSQISRKSFKQLHFNRNNKNYLMIINICKLLLCNLIVDTHEGNNKFADFITDNDMEKVYEEFIFNFYSKHLDKSLYKVYRPHIFWSIDDISTLDFFDLFDIDTNLTDRRTDIVIETKHDNRANKNIQIIIDAKYYKDILVPKYKDPTNFTYNTTHLNQLRGYLLDSNFDGNKIGALIYPTNNHKFEKGTILPIKDAKICIKTINLNQYWFDIKKDLLDFVFKICKVVQSKV